MKNFIFDLYGTLADVRTDEWSEDFWKRNAEYFRSLTARDINFKEQFNALMVKYCGDNEHETDVAAVLTALFRLGGAEYSAAEIYAIGGEIRRRSTQKLKLYNGVIDELKALRARGKDVYLLSNAQAMFTKPEIDGLGLAPLFDGAELSSDFGYRKPSAKFFDYVIQKYGLDKDESVYIGNDYDCDIRGAYGAGIQSVYIRTETSPVEDEPNGGFLDIRHFLNGDHGELFEFLLEL